MWRQAVFEMNGIVSRLLGLLRGPASAAAAPAAAAAAAPAAAAGVGEVAATGGGNPAAAAATAAAAKEEEAMRLEYAAICSDLHTPVSIVLRCSCTETSFYVSFACAATNKLGFRV